MSNRIGRDDDALFVKDGVPIKFCFHRSVTQGRGQITRDVERHGGKIVRDERLANVLLVDEQEDIPFMQRRYYSSTEVYRLSLYVEPRGFVQACIRSGSYQHVGSVKHGMPGRPQGGRRRGRVAFTEEDRDHLAYYLATRCPERDGRMGNSAYKDLERLGETDDLSWAWARRHTFHSWREHYKMNPVMMDARIDHYLRRLKDVGHHLGHDSRRHDRRVEEEEEEEEEEDQLQEMERQDRERREPARPAVAAAGRARGYLERHERDLVSFDEEEEDGEEEGEEEEVAVQELKRAKRHRVHAQQRREVQETQAKRARVSKVSSSKRRAPGVEASRGESRPARERESGDEESQEIEGDDLFGDREYEDEQQFEFDDAQGVDFPMPYSPRTSPAPEEGGAPLSTQATLVATPLSAQKKSIPTPGPTPTKVVERQVSKPTAPPSSQHAAVVTRERVVVQRARVRGASAQPGPSVPTGMRGRGGVTPAEAPFRSARARSRSVDPQAVPEAPRARAREDQGGKGKGKAKEETLASTEEDVQVEDEDGVASVAVTTRSGLSAQETFEDEMAVQGLLEASVTSGGPDVEDGASVWDEDDEEEEEEFAVLPAFQDVEIGSEPTDSDDAETHGSLVRGAVREGSAGGGDAEPSQDQEQNQEQEQEQDEESDEEDTDADRIERMASRSLRAVRTPTPPQPRVTRSQTRTLAQARTSPRWTRSGDQAHTGAQLPGFPSPGTKARAVVDRFQKEERRMPYAPPEGSRAAKTVKGRGRRG